MTTTRMHNEHAAGASKPEPASSPSFGSVLAEARAEERTARTPTAPVRGESPAERESSAARQTASPAAKQAVSVSSTQPGADSRQQSPVARSGGSEPSSGHAAAHDTKASGDSGSHRQQGLTEGAQIAQPAAPVAPAWTLPLTAQPSLAVDCGGSGKAPASAGEASATAASDSAEPAQTGRAQAHHGSAVLFGGLQDAIACVADDQAVNAPATGDAPASTTPGAISGSADSRQGTAATQLQAAAHASLTPGALRTADAATSAVSGKVSVTSANQVSPVKGDGSVSGAGAGKQDSNGSGAASSGGSGSSAAGTASSAHGQMASVTVTATPAKNADAGAVPVAATQAVPREIAQPASASSRSDIRQAADAHQADLPAEAGNSGAAAGINTAKLIQTMSETEMRVGLRSSEFGQISIRTLVSQQQMQAQISVDHSDLGHAISAHLPSVQTKLANDHGLKAMIEVSQSGMSFSGERGSTPQRDRRSSSAPQKESIDPVATHAEAAARLVPSGDADRLSIRA